jgi:hypothetical protein
MGFPTSEFGYTIAGTRRETSKVHKNMWWHWTKKNFLVDWSLTFATQTLFRSVLRTEDTPPIVVIGLQAIFMTGHNSGIPFPDIERFRCLKIPIIREYFHV